MRLIKYVFVLCFCLVLLSIPRNSVAAMNPKLKVLLTTAAYGTAGGALLGTATMAFGSNSRTIFQGASIGLYAGLIFGAYILYSHNAYKKTEAYQRGGYPTDPNSTYGEDEVDQTGEYEDVYFGQYNRVQVFQLERDLKVSERLNSFNQKSFKTIFVPVFQFQF